MGSPHIQTTLGTRSWVTVSPVLATAGFGGVSNSNTAGNILHVRKVKSPPDSKGTCNNGPKPLKRPHKANALHTLGSRYIPRPRRISTNLIWGRLFLYVQKLLACLNLRQRPGTADRCRLWLHGLSQSAPYQNCPIYYLVSYWVTSSPNQQ